MTTIFRAAGAADFLALVPRLLGYRPTRSLVLIPFDGNRTLGGLRLDLPATLGRTELDSMCSTYIGMVCKVSHADAVAVIAYTDETFAASEGPPQGELVRALLAQADLCGLRVSEALCVAADGWGSYLDAGCPPGGHPLTDIPYDHEAFADEPLPTEDQASGADLPTVDLAEKERLGLALREIDRAMSALFGDERQPSDRPLARDALSTVGRMDDVPLLLEEAIEYAPAEMDPYEAAAVVWCLMRPGLRDVALVQWARDLAAGDEAFAAQMRYADGGEYPEHLAAPIWGEGPSPDPHRLQAALALTRHLAAAAPRPARPGILAAAAWVAWALGRSTHAGRYAEMAREIDPGHGMAGIVLTFAASGHLPEWVYRRSVPSDPVTHLIDSRRVES
ncbi:DUF4192 family protein [Microbacterium sp. dk485]|uniref:DUF4192 family protein n=1 Tax=Microbacterium sp. dk485 TaxID=2560021 RepID=UPI001073CA4A|nr:DUF4192 family protein [Microbacterium sp. dk485]TFV84454.1 DUF4192 family protein [Microbacterium sp. dk485]